MKNTNQLWPKTEVESIMTNQTECRQKMSYLLWRLFNSCESYFGVPCVDLLVNNAGINSNLGWRKCMDVNIIGVMNGTEIALERMRKVRQDLYYLIMYVSEKASIHNKPHYGQ